jgi:hypothetical protein
MVRAQSLHMTRVLIQIREGEKGATLVTQNEGELENQWRQMSTGAKIADWAGRHEYSLILGAWASSLGLSAVSLPSALPLELALLKISV